MIAIFFGHAQVKINSASIDIFIDRIFFQRTVEFVFNYVTVCSYSSERHDWALILFGSSSSSSSFILEPTEL